MPQYLAMLQLRQLHPGEGGEDGQKAAGSEI
jgi:hypothetical protein